jgi:hypothetical protein
MLFYLFRNDHTVVVQTGISHLALGIDHEAPILNVTPGQVEVDLVPSYSIASLAPFIFLETSISVD